MFSGGACVFIKCAFLTVCLYYKPFLISLILHQLPKKTINEAAKLRYNCYVFRLLLPLLMELRQEQIAEKEIEARIHGMVAAETKFHVPLFSFHTLEICPLPRHYFIQN